MNAENGEEIVEEDVSEDQSASGSETTPGSKCYQLVKMGDSRVAVFKDTNFRVKLGHWQYFTRGTKRYGRVHERQAFCTFCDPEQQKPVCGSRPGLAAHLAKCWKAPESVRLEARTRMAEYYGRKYSKTYHKETDQPVRKLRNGIEDDNAGVPTESFSSSTLELSASSPAPVRRTRSKRVLDAVEHEPSPSLSLIPGDEFLTGLPAYSEESDVLTQLPEPSSQLDLERLKLEQEKTRLRHAFKMKKLSNRHAYRMEKLAVERLRIENDNMLLKMQTGTLNQPRKQSAADLQTD